MKFLTVLTVFVFSFSFAGKSYSQIEIFGISFEMTHEEIVLELNQNGYTGTYDDEFGFPVSCVQDGRLVEGECFVTWFDNPKIQSWWSVCSSQLDNLRECARRTGSSDFDAHRENCPEEAHIVGQCVSQYDDDFGLFDLSTGVFLYFQSEEREASPEDDTIDFQCDVFNGCDYTEEEIVRFLIDNIGDQFVRSRDGVVEVNDSCLTGFKGDQLCVSETEISLVRGKYGRPEMKLSLN